jgi:hypothetical protein
MSHHRGHCRCEGVVVLVSSEPEVSVYCHCDDCRRSAGAPLIAAIGINKATINWERDDTLARWTNGTCTRLFCRECGTPIAQEHESAPSRTYFNTAFMDEPELFPPNAHSYALEQLPWLELTDTLARHEKTVSITPK